MMAQLVQIPWKTWVCLSNKANTITANGLAKQGDTASVALMLT